MDLTPLFYRGAHGAIIVFDIMATEPLNSIERWKELLDFRILMPDNRTIPCVVLANKVHETKLLK